MSGMTEKETSVAAIAVWSNGVTVVMRHEPGGGLSYHDRRDLDKIERLMELVKEIGAAACESDVCDNAHTAENRSVFVCLPCRARAEEALKP